MNEDINHATAPPETPEPKTPTPADSMESPPLDQEQSDVKDKQDGARALLKYALDRNLDIDDDIIRRINSAAFTHGEDLTAEISTDLDTAIRDLTAITYPTTIETLNISLDPKFRSENFVIFVQVTGSAALILAIVALSFAEDEVGAPHYLVAALLGFLGTLVYIVFNLLGIVAEKAFRQDDNHGNQLRLLLGAIVGWALFYMLVPPGSSIKTHAPYLSIPFLVGYSTRLLVGLLDQFIRAVEITLGLEDKESKLARRQRRKPT